MGVLDIDARRLNEESRLPRKPSPSAAGPASTASSAPPGLSYQDDRTIRNRQAHVGGLIHGRAEAAEGALRPVGPQTGEKTPFEHNLRQMS